MDELRTAKVLCPFCVEWFKTNVYSRLENMHSTGVSLSVIRGDLFAVSCPHCNKKITLDYDLLYYDEDYSLNIYVVHPDHARYETTVEMIKERALYLKQKTRIVSSINELREKVSCLAGHKDDRIIVLCRINIEKKLSALKPDIQLKKSFYVYLNNSHYVLLYDDKGKRLVVQLKDAVYDKVAKLYEEAVRDMSLGKVMINDEWGKSMFSAYQHCESCIEEDELVYI